MSRRITEKLDPVRRLPRRGNKRGQLGLVQTALGPDSGTNIDPERAHAANRLYPTAEMLYQAFSDAVNAELDIEGLSAQSTATVLPALAPERAPVPDTILSGASDPSASWSGLDVSALSSTDSSAASGPRELELPRHPDQDWPRSTI